MGRFFTGVGRLVSLDWTTGYGLYPGHAFYLIGVLWALLTPIYMWPICRPGKWPDRRSGIYQILPADRIQRIDGDGKLSVDNTTKITQVTGAFWPTVCPAAYFSLLSAFNIGFQELNVGQWITRLQPREYSLRSDGWVRVVAGFQSLVSLGLLASGLNTYLDILSKK